MSKPINILHINSRQYLLMVLSIFVFGFSMAAIMTLDKLWWQGSTCSLGMQVNGTPEYYNYTFIISGALMMIFAIYLIPQIKLLIAKGIFTKLKTILLTILYFIEMITLMLVGIIRYGDNESANAIHVLLGFYVFINLGIVMLFGFWFFSKLSKKFILANYILFILALACYFLGIGAKLLPYAIAEILTIAIVIGWIGMTLTHIDKLNSINNITK